MELYKKLADAELWDLVVKDDHVAFKTVFERYWQSIFTTAHHYLKDREVCAEVVNDIFVNVWQKRHHLQILSLKAYLTAAARYHVYKEIRHAKLSPLVVVENYDLLSNIKEKGSPTDDKLTYAELEIDLGEHLLSLPKRCREIFILSRIESLSNDEIAARFNISKRTVENQITQALKHLRGCLKNLSIFFIFLTSI